MLTQWTLDNFKAAGPGTVVDLSRVTVFAGVNSSGKSSLLHSILFVAQTVQHPLGARHVVLNGVHVNLGDYQDLVFGNDASLDVSIGFSLDTPYEFSTTRTAHHSLESRRTLIQAIDCRFSFAPASQESDQRLLYPALRTSLIRCRDASGESLASLTTEMRSPDAATSGLGSTDDSALYNVQMAGDMLGPDPSDQIVGATHVHFLPRKIVREVDQRDVIAEAMTFGLAGLGLRRRAITGLRRTPLPPSVILLLRERLSSDNRLRASIAELATAPSLEEWSYHLDSLSQTKKVVVRDAILSIAGDIYRAVRKEFDIDLYRDYQDLPGVLEQATARIQDYFSTSVRYIGPLRDDPRSLYPHAPPGDTTDVGRRGEYTAAVLDMHGGSQVKCILPDGLAALDQPKATEVSLRDAVNSWLVYLSIGDEVRTRDLGKLGHELRVAVTPGMFRDLTHVGVGVSQVLPILVMCLLSPPGTTLILEQPELHLHPRVQTRLADFIISLGLSGRQCLIETHSEYFVNRLRLRSISPKGDTLRKSMRLYFVSIEDRRSVFRQVDINRYGAVLDWPIDFFDEGQRGAEDLLLAAARARRAERLRDDP